MNGFNCQPFGQSLRLWFEPNDLLTQNYESHYGGRIFNILIRMPDGRNDE